MASANTEESESSLSSFKTIKDDPDYRSSVMVKHRPSAGEGVKLEDFDIITELGRGTFGKVYLAELQQVEQIKYFAIKAIRKDVLVQHDHI